MSPSNCSIRPACPFSKRLLDSNLTFLSRLYLSSDFPKDSTKRFKASGNGVRLPTKETNSKCKVIQSRLNEVLGGKTWSSTPFFEYHLKLSSGVTYFEVLRACVLTALKLTTNPSNDGRLPLLLRQKIIPITRERIKSKNPKQSQKWISTSDLQNAHRMMKEEANQSESVSSNSSSE